MTLPQEPPRRILELAWDALAKIEATEKGQVRASIHGVVAAARINQSTYLFRRLSDGVRFEVWAGPNGHPKVETYKLPVALEHEAAEMLDSL